MSLRHGRPLLVVLPHLIVVACYSFEAPDRFRQPEATHLYFDEFRTVLGPSGVLVPQLVLEDGSRFDDERDFVRVQATTTSGDRETVTLGSPWCPVASPHAQVSCYHFVIWRDPEADTLELHRRVRESGARAVSGSPLWWVYSAARGTVIGRARAARSWPGVTLVSPGDAPCLHFDCSVIYVTGVLPVTNAVASRGDGVLQVVSGDTVALEYESASGVQLRSTVRVP